ncbi:MAG: hypothetical protein ACFFCW_07000 [Candidatus Hodarchaeota archaeon]
MAQYLSNEKENQVRNLLDELAEEINLYCEKKEAYFSGYYLDRLWYKILEEQKIPFVAFEIEKGVPTNERLRKDIMNIAWTRAPVGYIILPHNRILNDPKVNEGGNWANWYKKNFFLRFNEYRKPFIFYCDIKIIDADKLLSSRCLRDSVVLPTP